MIDAGLGDKLMLDWMEPSEKLGTDHRIYVLCPASHGHEADLAPGMDDFYPGGSLLGGLFGMPFASQPCTLLKDGKCTIHDTTFKPRMCREVFACKAGTGPDKYDMAPEWNSQEGRSLVASWCKQHGVDLAKADNFS